MCRMKCADTSPTYTVVLVFTGCVLLQLQLCLRIKRRYQTVPPPLFLLVLRWTTATLLLLLLFPRRPLTRPGTPVQSVPPRPTAAVTPERNRQHRHTWWVTFLCSTLHVHTHTLNTFSKRCNANYLQVDTYVEKASGLKE